MFRRNNRHESAPPPRELVLPTDGRQISLLPGHEDNPEMPARVISQYSVVDLETGRSGVTTEMIWAQSVTDQPKRMRVGEAVELLDLVGRQVEKIVENPTMKSGRYILEYPRVGDTDSIRGEVYVLGPQITRYAFEENGDEVTVTGAEAVESTKQKLELPVGTRMTATVSMKEEGAAPKTIEELAHASANNSVNVTEIPTPEEEFTARIKNAIGLYKETHR